MIKSNNIGKPKEAIKKNNRIESKILRIALMKVIKLNILTDYFHKISHIKITILISSFNYI